MLCVCNFFQGEMGDVGSKGDIGQEGFRGPPVSMWYLKLFNLSQN